LQARAAHKTKATVSQSVRDGERDRGETGTGTEVRTYIQIFEFVLMKMKCETETGCWGYGQMACFMRNALTFQPIGGIG